MTILPSSRLYYGAILPDLQQLGVSEDNPGLRAVYGFKAMMPLYPFIGVFTFIGVLQDKELRATFKSDVDLIRHGMKHGFRRWIPIAIGSAVFYGLEVACRPVIYRALSEEEGESRNSRNPPQVPQGRQNTIFAQAKKTLADFTGVRHAGYTTVRGGENSDDSTSSETGRQAQSKKKFMIVAGNRDLPEWSQTEEEGLGNDTETNNDEGLTKSNHRSTASTESIEENAAVSPSHYYPPIVGSQMVAGSVAALLVSLPNIRSLGVFRFLALGALGMFAGTMVPSYESAMANKKY
eukprot:gb/GECG01012472.1/.p1 GENE.gb/GECG01012472.1/~~gb/GECG01012472.1/.p1  ORF type:complete len:293 (+),score=33.18 gb/GECG01012472.1/:1-879(+)